MRRLLLPAGIACIALLGCGGGATFTAQEFIAQANENGAGLVLGGELDSARAGTELHSVELEELDSPARPRLEAEGHAGGTLTITESDGAGAAEHERCEQAISLLCYRAANVVLFFEDALEPAEQVRIAAAIRRMASEDPP